MYGRLHPPANRIACHFLPPPRECFMLVLTRKYQEKIKIGDNITITVLRTKGKAVRLGIEAPANVPVIRGELKFEDELAAATVADDASVPAGIGSGRRSESFAEPTWTTKRLPREGDSRS